MECHIQGHTASVVEGDPYSSTPTLPVPHVIVTCAKRNRERKGYCLTRIALLGSETIKYGCLVGRGRLDLQKSDLGFA